MYIETFYLFTSHSQTFILRRSPCPYIYQCFVSLHTRQFLSQVLLCLLEKIRLISGEFVNLWFVSPSTSVRVNRPCRAKPSGSNAFKEVGTLSLRETAGGWPSRRPSHEPNFSIWSRRVPTGRCNEPI